MPSFEHPFLTRATWANAGLQTPGKALETFMWAWTTKNETALAEVCTKDINGQPTKLTGLATDWDERVMGVQVLSFGFQKGNPDQLRCSMIAEMRTEMENQNGPFEGLTHQFLNLQFKREDGMWRFDGRPPY